MYPLVLILATSILRKDNAARHYGLPLAFLGLAVSIYHNLLYYKIIPDSIKPCTSGVSCTAKQIEWLGFVTIPLLSLMAFCVITICLSLTKTSEHQKGKAF